MNARHLAPRRLLAIAATAGLLAAAVGGGPVLGQESEGDQPIDFTHSVVDAPAPVTSAVFGTDGSLKSGQVVCTTTTSTAANVNTDCEAAPGPHNETSIAVNPTDHDNIVGGANDYQLGLNPGFHVTETVLSRAHVSFDGGDTWSMYPIVFDSSYQATGDPAVAFDASGHAYYATLGFRFVGPANVQSPDVLVANSGDGGVHWSSVRVASGSGTFGSVGHLLDKEYLTAWGNGNALLTFGDYTLGPLGSYVQAVIKASVTHDHGATWSKPVTISGSKHDAFVSVPARAADGSIYVSFLNTDDLSTGRDSYYVVKVNGSTGAAVGNPVKVADVIDGATDYPIAFGRQTYQDSTFRSWAAGNVTTDPTDSDHLAVVWSDMRNSTLPAPTNPYDATTDSDVIVSESTDGGATWGAAFAIELSGDQWMPWGAYDAGGTLRIGTFDRSGDADNHKYDFSLLNQTGATTFSRTVVTTVQSDPTTGNRWFAGTLDPDFPNPTSFIGDYAGIGIVPGTTHVVAYWTDLRETACFPAGVCRHGSDAYFAAVP